MPQLTTSQLKAPPSTGANINWSKPVTADLLYAWTFSEGIVTLGYDMFKRGRDFTFTSLSGVDASFDGNAVAPKFDGTASRAECSLTLSGTQVITVSFWMYWDTFANDDDLAMEYTGNFNSSVGGFIIDPNSSVGYISCNVRGNAGYNDARYNRPSAGEWHHYSAIFDKSTATSGTDEIGLYIDGVFQTPVSKGNSNNNDDAFANDSLYLFHRNNFGSRSLFGAGRIQNLMIHQRALTQADVWALYTDPFYSWLEDNVYVIGSKTSGGIAETPASVVLAFTQQAPGQLLGQPLASAVLSLVQPTITQQVKNSPASTVLTFVQPTAAQLLTQSPASAVLSFLKDADTLNVKVNAGSAVLSFTLDLPTLNAKQNAASAIASFVVNNPTSKLNLTAGSAVLTFNLETVVSAGFVESPASAVLNLVQPAITSKLNNSPASVICSFIAQFGTIACTQSPASAILSLVQPSPTTKLTLLVSSAQLNFTTDAPTTKLANFTPSAIAQFLNTQPNLLLVVQPSSAALQFFSQTVVQGGFVEFPASAIIQFITDNPSTIIGLFGYPRYDRMLQDKQFIRVAQKKTYKVD